MDKLKIICLEGSTSGVVLEAQFNPKEIDIQKSIPWQRQPAKGPSDLTYAGGGGRTMSCELLFDGFSTGTSVQDEIDKLQMLSDIDTALKRPPKVKVVWGAPNGSGLMPGFEAVIEELAVKYTMVDPNGRPLRATVGLKFREARNVMVAKIV